MADRSMVDHANQKYRESSQWWLAFDFAVYRYRCWALLWVSRRRLRRRLGRRPGLEQLDHLINEAHDRLLIESENIRMTERCAMSAEMAGRIYYEEYEGREAYRIKNENPDDV